MCGAIQSRQLPVASVGLGMLFESSAWRVDDSAVIGVTNVEDDAKGKKDDVTNAGVHGAELKL
jgi:hypothetical protein